MFTCESALDLQCIELPLTERAVETFLWNGMDKKGGRAHTMVVKGEKIAEKDIHESYTEEVNIKGGKSDDYHGERYVPEFQMGKAGVVVYMDKTPCIDCVEWLIKQYKNVPKGQKPIMFVSYLYPYPNVQQSLKGLDKLHDEGFKICPANIQAFGLLFDNYYRNFINQVAKTDAFEKGQNTLKNYLQNNIRDTCK